MRGSRWTAALVAGVLSLFMFATPAAADHTPVATYDHAPGTTEHGHTTPDGTGVVLHEFQDSWPGDRFCDLWINSVFITEHPETGVTYTLETNVWMWRISKCEPTPEGEVTVPTEPPTTVAPPETAPPTEPPTTPAPVPVPPVAETTVPTAPPAALGIDTVPAAVEPVCEMDPFGNCILPSTGPPHLWQKLVVGALFGAIGASLLIIRRRPATVSI